MAYTTINKPSEYFNTKLYTGNDTTQSITGVGFQPDWVWIKDRDAANNHELFDAVRGATKRIYTDTTDAQDTNSNSLTSFDSDGFSVGSNNSNNDLNHNYASWNWLGGGTGVSNTDGSITSTVSANTTSGFSIVSYTGTGANATVGHGLGVAPKCIIVKNYSRAGENWRVGILTGSTSFAGSLQLDNTGAYSTGTNIWNNTAPTSSVFSVGTAQSTNYSGDNLIAYCFAEKKGFSKFGSYVGNGSTDGTFIYTGFKPAFVIHKRTNSTAHSWLIHDNKRPDYNSTDKILEANLADAEQSGYDMDLLSNGFKHRITSGSTNASGGTYIYMAFAENPLVGTNNIPATAR